MDFVSANRHRMHSLRARPSVIEKIDVRRFFRAPASTDIPICCGCNAEGTSKMACEMTLVREAAICGDFCDIAALAEESPCSRQTHGQLVRMRRDAEPALECAQHLIATHSGLAREGREAQEGTSVVNAFPNTFRTSRASPFHGQAIGPERTPHELCCEGLHQDGYARLSCHWGPRRTKRVY